MKPIHAAMRLWLWLVFCIFLPGLIMAQDTLDIPAGYVGNYTTVLGIPIRYYQVGQGPDILFIHGQPGSIEDWQPLIKDLSAHYRLTFYDRPGNGFSGATNLDYTLRQNADVALALIDKLHLENPVVVGHSYGGGVVLDLAVRKPAGIKAFVSVAGCAYPVGKSDMIIRLLRLPYVGRGIIALIPHSTGCSMIGDGILKAFHPNAKSLPPDLIASRCQIWSHPQNMLTMAREDGHLDADLKKIMPQYKEITHTVYLVHGVQDQMVNVEESKKLSSELPHAHLHLLEETGHMVQYVRTDDLIKIIDKAVLDEK